MKSSIAAAFLCVVLAPFGGFCLAWAVVFLRRGTLLSAVVALGSAVFTLALVAMLAFVASRKVTPRTSRDDSGITVRPDRKVDSLLAASTVGAWVAMVLYAIFAPLDMLEIAVPRSNERYLVVVCAVAGLVGLMSLRQIVRRRGTSYVRMTVDGVEMGNTVTSMRRPWAELTDVADRPLKARQTTGATYIRTVDGYTRVLPTDWYTPGGRALRELLRFYWQYPDHRDELVDGRALTRLARPDIPHSR